MAARLLLELAYTHVDEGITFGGELLEVNPRLSAHMHGEIDLEGPPTQDVETHADTTWNCDPDCFAAVVQRFGGALIHGVWRISMTCDCSQLAEAMGTCRAAEKLALVQEMERGVGLARELPGVITTDSTSNWQVATRHGTPNKSRHALRRWRVLTERLQAREAKLVCLPGVSMPADFMTKNSPGKVINASVHYITNAANAVPAPAKK